MAQPRYLHLHPSSNTFGSADAAIIKRSFVVTSGRFRDELRHLVNGAASGSIDFQTFSRRSGAILRRAFEDVFALGALSVDPFHILTSRDIQLVERELSQERRFLRAFGRDLVDGFYDLYPISRSQLYLRSLRGIFELGRLAAGPQGPYEWKLGDSEHCRYCLSASLNGPYQFADYSGLGLPVLPGIPGSGEVCQGLTRCRCIIRLASFVPLPNEELQREIGYSIARLLDDDGSSVYSRAAATTEFLL